MVDPIKRAMRISTIQVDQATTPFDISFHSGRAFRTESESVVLRLGYDNGITSCGESAPRPYVTGETLASVTELIRDRFAPRLLNREIGCLEDVASVLDDLERFCLHESLKPYHSALGAVDVALLDGLGKLRNRPVAFYLGNPSPNPGAAHSVSVPLLPDDKIRELFQRFRHYPFTHLKVLVGDDLTWNVDRLALLRSLFGDGVDLRIEVNGKWCFDQALANATALKKFKISAVEQPLPAHDIEGMRRFRTETGMPVIADESLCTLSDAKRLIESRACDILNIKVSKCGGLLRSRAVAELASSARMPCQLGAHVGETEILAAAGRHFAATTDLLWIDGGYAFLLFGAGLRKEPRKELEGPGLGLQDC